MKLALSLFSFVLLAGFSASSQIDYQATALSNKSICFIKNDGQWHDNVNYRCPLGTGSVYLEDNVFTYSQLDAGDIDVAHSHSGDAHLHGEKHMVNGHAWRTTFVDANAKPILIGTDKRTEYHNYFIGNDKSNWASNVPLFNAITYDDLYTGIDMKVYSVNKVFKYDFIVAQGSNPAIIKMNYTGLDKIELRNGNLVSVTSIGEYIEKAPYAYQMVNGEQVEVACDFVLEGTTVSFEFPEGYNESLELVIDPELIGATLSGSTTYNFGHCATYDSDENIYTGARAYGVGYPTEDGSFQTDFGGSQDIAISKLNPTGSILLYATYLGGLGQDLPHSMVCSDDNELYVFGSTRSIDYPVADDAFDDIGPAGGTTTDIIVTHLTEDGTDIVGSTFVGGASNDGINTLTSNYGDGFRGEIVVDDEGNCYIASCSASADFPTTAGAYQETYGGGTQDGVIFSMSSDLTVMNWSTFLGGANGEGGLGLRLDYEDNVYVSGVASDEFMAMSGYQTTYQGGERDAFAIRLIDDGATLSASTYWGTTAKDAAFFIDLDNDGNVFLYGQSNGGTSEVTDDVYVNPGSHQFICKLSPDLEDLEFGTVVGAGGANFIPIAFMVDACGYVYFSGHTATGALPLTDDALYVTGGFYLGVLQPEAVDLEFATLYSGNHVDGGTSRFDPENGVVYQAVCSCEPFTTTPDAYSTTTDLFCDIGVFKIDFGIAHVNANANASPSAVGCIPFTVDFENGSTGLTYEWDFDDGGAMSTDFEPSHTFTTPGVYNVRLVAFDPDGCLTSDTTFIEIVVGDGESPIATFDYELNCATGAITITYTGSPDVPVVWDMGDGTIITDEYVFTHTYGGDGSFTITLTAGDAFCSDYTIVTEDIIIGSPSVEIIFNNPTCYLFSDGSVTVDVIAPTGEELIEITDIDGTLLNVGGSNTANTLSSGWYYFTVDLGDGCELSDSIQLIDPPAINAQINLTHVLCYGDETGGAIVDTVFNAQGDYGQMVYIWAPDPYDVSGLGGNEITDLGAGNYTLTINDDNGCSRVFDFEITEPDELIFSEFGMESAYCRQFGYQSGNGVIFASAIGGVPDYNYIWTNLETGDTHIPTTWGGLNPGTYEMTVTDQNGCILTQQIELDSLNPVAEFTIETGQTATDCDAIVPADLTFTNQSLYFANPNNPVADTTFLWSFNHPNSDWVISHNYYEEFNITYTESGTIEICLIAQNKNGCADTTCKDIILCNDLEFETVNIFTPDGDGINDDFTFVYRSEAVVEFSCVVINRWGVTIAEFNDITQGWDGTDKQGQAVADGVYFFSYAGKGQTGETFFGQGTVQVVKKGN
ncbi:MAG: PKD domain-containing protein [Crocinitomix sp.]|nr:PKD domain-containing protein [Crocinitomix sp.]